VTSYICLVIEPKSASECTDGIFKTVAASFAKRFWYGPLNLCFDFFSLGTEDSSAAQQLTVEEYNSKKARLSHIVSGDRTEHEVISLTRDTLSSRRAWITEDSPTAAEILRQFPRFMDTPSLVGAFSFRFHCRSLCSQRIWNTEPAKQLELARVHWYLPL
jgi:hypothetical protein